MKGLIFLCVCAWASPCSAAGALADLLACRDLTDAQARLACFDRETAALVHMPAVPIAATPTPIPAISESPAPRATQLTPEQKFGLSEDAIGAKEAAAGTQAVKETKLHARITALALTGDGRSLITLDNSQVWGQSEADGTDLLAKLGDAVTLSRGMLGSYWLQLKSGRGCKVRRMH